MYGFDNSSSEIISYFVRKHELKIYKKLKIDYSYYQQIALDELCLQASELVIVYLSIRKHKRQILYRTKIA